MKQLILLVGVLVASASIQAQTLIRDDGYLPFDTANGVITYTFDRVYHNYSDTSDVSDSSMWEHTNIVVVFKDSQTKPLIEVTLNDTLVYGYYIVDVYVGNPEYAEDATSFDTKQINTKNHTYITVGGIPSLEDGYEYITISSKAPKRAWVTMILR